LLSAAHFGNRLSCHTSTAITVTGEKNGNLDAQKAKDEELDCALLKRDVPFSRHEKYNRYPQLSTFLHSNNQCDSKHVDRQVEKMAESRDAKTWAKRAAQECKPVANLSLENGLVPRRPLLFSLTRTEPSLPTTPNFPVFCGN